MTLQWNNSRSNNKNKTNKTTPSSVRRSMKTTWWASSRSKTGCSFVTSSEPRTLNLSFQTRFNALLIQLECNSQTIGITLGFSIWLSTGKMMKTRCFLMNRRKYLMRSLISWVRPLIVMKVFWSKVKRRKIEPALLWLHLLWESTGGACWKR